jgi:putative oxidoreductase
MNSSLHSLTLKWNALTEKFSCWLNHDILAVFNRFAIASIFFLSGRTKVEDIVTIKESTFELFRTEYQLPFIPPELAAHMATYAEHLFPILLVLGLCTRLSSLALFGMTLVIQIFVYPDAWPTHLSWAALSLYLVANGGGKFSLDHFFKSHYFKK